MRELEMRMRVFQFLKTRLRNTIMPATVGIGLAVGGCAKEGLLGNPDAAKDVAADQRLPTLYGLVSPPDLNTVADIAGDSGFDGLSRDTPIYGTPDVPRDVNVAVDQSSALDTGSIDSGRDLGIITKYIAPIPDASADTRIIGVLYAAIVPVDAGADVGGVATRYGAQNPDAS